MKILMPSRGKLSVHAEGQWELITKSVEFGGDREGVRSVGHNAKLQLSNFSGGQLWRVINLESRADVEVVSPLGVVKMDFGHVVFGSAVVKPDGQAGFKLGTCEVVT